MLGVSPIAGVHFKVCFGVVKIIESLIEHFLKIFSLKVMLLSYQNINAFGKRRLRNIWQQKYTIIKKNTVLKLCFRYQLIFLLVPTPYILIKL